MATLTNAICKQQFDEILPVYGTPRVQIPIWDEGRKMFIIDEYESKRGHRHYRGVRFCDRIVILEKSGGYHSWTYLNGLELYAFNGKRLDRIQTRDYDKVHRKDEFVRTESEGMVRDFLAGVCKAQHIAISKEDLAAQAKLFVDGCYKSFLDADYNTRLTQILPAIEEK